MRDDLFIENFSIIKREDNRTLSKHFVESIVAVTPNPITKSVALNSRFIKMLSC